jgi:hypothetical protein
MGRGQNHVFTAEVSQLDNTPSRKWMTPWDHENCAHGCEQLAIYAFILERQRGDADIERAIRDPVGNASRVFDLQRNAGVRMRDSKCRDRGRQNAERRHHGRYHAKMRILERANIPRNVDDLINRGQCPLGLAIEHPSFFAGHKPAPLPNKQWKSKFLLEIGNEPTNSGLRHVQLLSRPCDGSRFEDCAEGLKPLEVHAGASISGWHVITRFSHLTWGMVRRRVGYTDVQARRDHGT